MKGDADKLENQERQVAASQIYQAARLKWKALNNTEKQQLLTALNNWNMATHTAAENALYGGLILVIVSLGNILNGDD